LDVPSAITDEAFVRIAGAAMNVSTAKGFIVSGSIRAPDRAGLLTTDDTDQHGWKTDPVPVLIRVDPCDPWLEPIGAGVFPAEFYMS
jgi:hypothetical protein